MNQKLIFTFCLVGAVLACLPTDALHAKGIKKKDPPKEFKKVEKKPIERAKVYETTKTQREVYTRALEWISETFVSGKDVIDHKDPETFTVIGSPHMEASIAWGVYNKFRMKMRVEAKEGRFRIKFYKVQSWADILNRWQDDMEGAYGTKDIIKKIEAQSDKCASYINKAESKDDDW